MHQLIYILLFSFATTFCNSKEELPDFVTNDQQLLDEYANKALEEAQVLLDSLEQTPILNTDL